MAWHDSDGKRKLFAHHNIHHFQTHMMCGSHEMTQSAKEEVLIAICYMCLVYCMYEINHDMIETSFLSFSVMN
jgi:hypothetical protein